MAGPSSVPVPCPHYDALRVGPRPRCYACLKAAAMNGGRSKLTIEQLQFVGFDLAPPPERGWVPAWTIPALSQDDDIDPNDPVRRGILYSMRAPSGDRLELSA
jgi:hypothetical protein